MANYRKTLICPSCQTEFVARSSATITCSHDCRFLHYTQQRGDGCWNWTGFIGPQGYGSLFVEVVNGRRKNVLAHRYALTRSGVEIPPGRLVMHTCDNRKCVNPAHLKIGTWGDNNRDRSLKGRSGSRVYSEDELVKYRLRFRGEGNTAAKLTEDQVRAIRIDPRGCTTVGRAYGVSKAMVLRIRSRRAWSHVA